ncbi:hypothetical protein DVA86_17680 [Streptomyces armeniacus]|uniref:Nucleopolyhedrovirus P10 family protein n=1 Tax=Streptomyces armeniacus TaxID=83291 RepID=A0A345XRE2_9ACTN|nr:hypothetical protein [Streptomyces armeniacus]AXK34208.1 hypothetical protein DVA86_17680 [Streptomyces armeniacus]
MAADPLADAVRRQLRHGRLLPLGGPDDGAWITEHAAVGVLRRAAAGVHGVRPGAFRLALADAAAAVRPAVPAPPSALPYGPLRLEAEFAAAAYEPLPGLAERVRTALDRAADERLGLAVRVVDLRVSALLDDDAAESGDAGSGGEYAGTSAAGGKAGSKAGGGAVADAVTAVPGVAGLAPALAPGGVRVTDRDGDGDDDGGTESGVPAGRHVQVEIATAAGHRALDVARAARAAAEAAAAGPGGPPVTAAVLVTAVGAG